MNLYMAKKHIPLQITYVPNIGLLKSMGLRVGTTVAVQHRYAWGGPVLLNIDNAFLVAVGKDVAVQITAAQSGGGHGA